MNNKTCTEIENGPDQDCHPLKDSIQLNSHHSKITPKKPLQSSVKKKYMYSFGTPPPRPHPLRLQFLHPRLQGHPVVCFS